MTKQEFLARLREGLAGLPQEDIAERLTFYEEMIADRMEDGLAEEEAVAAAGSADEIIKQIVAETPLTKIVKERVRDRRRMKAWEIIFLVLGSPIWLSLLIAAFAVLLSIYIVIWALILSLWAVWISFIAGALAGVAAGIVLLCRGSAMQGLSLIAAGIVLAGLTIFLFYGCKAATKGAAVLTKKIALGIKSLFIGKEKNK